MEENKNQQKKENPFLSLAANLVLPVIILNKSHLFPTQNKALIALVVALFFPVAYGLWDYFTNSRKNYISILGVVNTLVTGAFAVLKLGGDWFAIKEAAFPAVLGATVYFSSYLKKPILKTVLVASGLLRFDKIQEAAANTDNVSLIDKIFIKCNNLFAVSFFVSALLNFLLALYIFSPLPEEMSEEAKSVVLNEQISQMTWKGLVVIGLPMTLFLALTFFILFRDLKKATGLSEDEILAT